MSRFPILAVSVFATSLACGGVSSQEPDASAVDASASDGSAGLVIDTCSTHILFQDQDDVWTIATDGGERDKLTTDGVNGFAEWSERGLIALRSVRGAEDNIVVMKEDGSDPVVVSGSDTPATRPQWIPGPTDRVAYTIESGQDATLVAVDAIGGRETIRDIEMLAGTQIGWSESGTRYTFFGPSTNPAPETAFWIGTVGNTGRSGFSSSTFGRSAWSPGDDRILYEQSRNIFTVSSGAGTATIANLTELGGSLRASDPQWYSSNRILFTRDSVPSGPSNLYIMNDDGSDQRALTTDDMSANVRLSPDKKQLVFERGDTIAVMEIGTDLTVGEVVAVTTGSRPRWKPCSP